MTGLTPEFAPDPTRALPVHETLALAGVPADAVGKPHFVVVTTREIDATDQAPAGSLIATRFWHPRDRLWQIGYFESLEHALHFFVEESGWTSMQEQSLDARLAHELIFRARESDFGRAHTAEQVLQEVGMTPEEVEDLLHKVDHQNRDT